MTGTSLLLGLGVGVLALGLSPANAVEVSLRLAGRTGRSAQFVRGGIPLPTASVSSDAKVKLVLAAGRAVPCEYRPVAYWPDGSVKWMLVGCFAPPGMKHAVASIGTDVEAPEPATRVRVQRGDSGFVVDTGPLRFVVDKEARGFVRGARLSAAGSDARRPQVALLRDDDEARRWGLDYYVTEQAWPSTRAVPPPGRIAQSKLVVDAVELEEEGTLHACVVVRGRYLHEGIGRRFKGRPFDGSRVDIRIHAFAGQSYLVIQHTFVYEGDPQRDFLQRLALDVPLNFVPDKAKRVTTVGGQERTEQWMYANPLFATDPPDVPNRDNAFPYWRRGGLVQTTSDEYYTYKLAEPDGGPLVMDRGRRAAGWIDISQPEPAWGCAIGVVDMSENFPAGLAAGNEEATVSALLYPPEATPLDLRRYTQIFGTGEADGFCGKATGISKTHTLWVQFHYGDWRQGRCDELAEALGGHPILMAAPDWIADTGALGPIHPSDAGTFPRIESLLTDMTDFMLAHQRRYRWYGIFDYGDFQSTYRFGSPLNPTDNLRWMNDWGRWGWVNDEALITHWLMVQFLRTGRPEYWRAADAMVAHVRDVDVEHSSSYPLGRGDGPFDYIDARGAGHRHNVHHWGDAYLGPRVANPVAWRLHYYLTGDGRTRDAIDEVYQANVVENRVWSSCDSMPTALYALYGKYEMTHDPAYRRTIDAFVRAYVDHALDRGQFASNTPWNFAEGRPLEPFSGTGSDSFFWHSFGMANFLLEWQALTQDERLAEALVAHGRATLTDTGWHEDYCQYQMLATAYRLSGDQAFRTRTAGLLARQLGAKRPVPADRGDWFGLGAWVGPKTISMMGFMANGLPFVMGAFDGEQALWPPGREQGM